MSFTRRHYETIAGILQRTRDTYAHVGAGDDGAHAALDTLTIKVCEAFTADNPRFNRAQFEAACAPGADVRARPPK